MQSKDVRSNLVQNIDINWTSEHYTLNFTRSMPFSFINYHELGLILGFFIIRLSLHIFVDVW